MAERVGTAVGMPSAGGIRTSLIDYALGAGGGLLYALSVGLLGSGLIGGLIGAVLAGSMIKGERGTAIATILGFMTIAGGLSGGGASATTATTRAVM